MRLRLRAAERLDFKPELIMLAVKTQDVVKAAGEIEPFAGGVPLVTMQNGVRSDELVAAY